MCMRVTGHPHRGRPEAVSMTAEDLIALRDRLRYILDAEEGGDRFSHLENDYSETIRARARDAIADIVVTEAADRARFQVAKEVYDLGGDIQQARRRKVRALAVQLMDSDSTTLPDNLVDAERDYINSVIRIREAAE